jgi:alpha-ribazole phosphatase
MLITQSQTALIVTHGGVIKLLKCMALQQSLDDILKMSAELGQLNRFMLDSETMQLELLESNK